MIKNNEIPENVNPNQEITNALQNIMNNINNNAENITLDIMTSNIALVNLLTTEPELIEPRNSISN